MMTMREKAKESKILSQSEAVKKNNASFEGCISAEAVNATVGVMLVDDIGEAGKTGRIKKMSNEYEKAAEIADNITKAFEMSVIKLRDATQKSQQEAKLTSSKVRQVAADLQSALSKVESQANFYRLERYVVLLERAATAMTILSDLDKNGKLKKITDALK